MTTRSRTNSAYMIAEKLVHTGVNFVVFALTARFLGPELFGEFGLLQALFFVGMPLSVVASEQTLIKLTLAGRHAPGTLYVQALIAKSLSSILVYAITVVGVYLVFGPRIGQLSALMCLLHLTNIDLVLYSYLRAREDSRLVFLSKTAIMVPSAALKIFVVYRYNDLLPLVLVFLLEYLLYSTLAFVQVRRQLTLAPVFDEETMRGLLRSAWPIFTATFLVTLYSRVDQMMIGSMMDAASMGHYTTAVKISEASTYLMTTYILSRFPEMMRLRESERRRYDRRIVVLLRQSFLYGIVVLATASLIALPLLRLIFGDAFLPAYEPLLIHLGGAMFIYAGIICTQWLIAEDLEIYRLLRVSAGLVINIALNLLWIPRYGIVGAAAATVVGQFTGNVLFNALSARTRPYFVLQLNALGIPGQSGANAR